MGCDAIDASWDVAKEDSRRTPDIWHLLDILLGIPKATIEIDLLLKYQNGGRPKPQINAFPLTMQTEFL